MKSLKLKYPTSKCKKIGLCLEQYVTKGMTNEKQHIRTIWDTPNIQNKNTHTFFI